LVRVTTFGQVFCLRRAFTAREKHGKPVMLLSPFTGIHPRAATLDEAVEHEAGPFAAPSEPADRQLGAHPAAVVGDLLGQLQGAQVVVALKTVEYSIVVICGFLLNNLHLQVKSEFIFCLLNNPKKKKNRF
jgi:hypothetical protein